MLSQPDILYPFDNAGRTARAEAISQQADSLTQDVVSFLNGSIQEAASVDPESEVVQLANLIGQISRVLLDADVQSHIIESPTRMAQIGAVTLKETLFEAAVAATANVMQSDSISSAMRVADPRVNPTLFQDNEAVFEIEVIPNRYSLFFSQAVDGGASRSNRAVTREMVVKAQLSHDFSAE